MLASLSNATSDIPLVSGSTKQSAGNLNMFGKNTAAAVREGAQNAVAGAIERSVRTLRSSAYDPTIILTFKLWEPGIKWYR